MDVVIIDDDEDLRFATSLALRSGGYSPHPFATCDAAVAELLLGEVKPSAILLDLNLDEGMTPAVFIETVRAHGFSSVPIVLVSGRPDLAQHARSMGAAAHLTKPFEIAQLLARLKTVTTR